MPTVRIFNPDSVIRTETVLIFLYNIASNRITAIPHKSKGRLIGRKTFKGSKNITVRTISLTKFNVS
jgi:hypothetical protein